MRKYLIPRILICIFSQVMKLVKLVLLLLAHFCFTILAMDIIYGRVLRMKHVMNACQGSPGNARTVIAAKRQSGVSFVAMHLSSSNMSNKTFKGRLEFNS